MTVLVCKKHKTRNCTRCPKPSGTTPVDDSVWVAVADSMAYAYTYDSGGGNSSSSGSSFGDAVSNVVDAVVSIFD